MGVLLLVTGALLAGACLGLAAAHLRDVRRERPASLDGLRAVVRRAPRDERAGVLASAAPAGSRLAALGAALRDGPSTSARAAAANDVLGELAGALEASAAWPAVAVRLAAFGGLLLVVIAVLARAGAVVVAVDASLALVAALVAARLGGVARTEAGALRAAVDELVALCVPPEARAEPAERAPRGARRGARR